MKRLNLIDGYGYVFRAFYGLPPLTNRKGEPVGAVFGFCRMMIKLMKQRPDELFLAVFDSGSKTFRNDIYKEYKIHRKEAPEDLQKQFPIIREACQALGVEQDEKKGFEADDLIATYAKNATAAGYRVDIISGDKDFMQLLANPLVKIFHPMQERELTLEDVTKKFGVSPEHVAEVQAIMGDSTDNIPGIPGIGPKGAADLINQFSSLENLYDHVEELPKSKRKELLIQHKDLAFISKQLVILKDDVEVRSDFEDMHLKPMHTEFLEENGFKSIIPAEKKILKTTHIKIESLEEFLKIAQDSLNLYIRVTEHATDQIIECYTAQHLFATENNIPQFVKDFEDILKAQHITKIFHAPKEIIYACHAQQIELQNYHSLESMSLCLFSGKLDHSLKSLEDHYQTIDLYTKLVQDLQECHAVRLYERAERFLPEVLVAIEEQGVTVDLEYLKALEQKLKSDIAKEERVIYEIAGETFNLNSPQQLGVILFEKMHIPAKAKTKTGQYATDSEVLEKIDAPIAKRILQYRQLTKLLNTYVLPLLEKGQNAQRRIHSTFIHNTVLTGRLASKNPNLQNIPVSEFRQAFIAPDTDHVLISFDYSQIELRLVAHISQEPALIKAFQNGEDIHAATALQLFGHVTDETRRHAKVVNFGILYGMGAMGLADSLGVSKARGQEIIDQYFAKYPRIKDYVDTQKHLAKTKGFVETIHHKRIYIQHIQDRFAGMAERQSINAPLQGSSADLIKMAMTKIYHWLMDENLKSKMILQIHDELIFEAPLTEQALILAEVKRTMEKIDTLTVPLLVNASVGRNWFEVS